MYFCLTGQDKPPISVDRSTGRERSREQQAAIVPTGNSPAGPVGKLNCAPELRYDFFGLPRPPFCAVLLICCPLAALCNRRDLRTRNALPDPFRLYCNTRHLSLWLAPSSNLPLQDLPSFTSSTSSLILLLIFFVSNFHSKLSLVQISHVGNDWDGLTSAANLCTTDSV